MKVLVINCGSSSLKYQLIDSDTEAVIAKGLCERIGIDGKLTHQTMGKDKYTVDAAMPDHNAAVKFVLDALLDTDKGAIASLSEIDAVGHRIVHGGEKFANSVVITDEVMAAIEECNDLAPLHNPANLIGIRACQAHMPGVPMVAVFDTAFHQTMPDKAYTYAIPYEYYENYKIRRYGFHGTSHSFVSKRLAELIGKDIKDTTQYFILITMNERKFLIHIHFSHLYIPITVIESHQRIHFIDCTARVKFKDLITCPIMEW
jgi:acetate kinase